MQLNTAAIVALGLTFSTPGLAQDVAELTFQNSWITLQALSLGDGTCELEVDAEIYETTDPDSSAEPYEVDNITITGADLNIELIPQMYNFMLEDDPCTQDADTLFCKAYTMLTMDAPGWWDSFGNWVDGYWSHRYFYLVNSSTPTGSTVYSIRQETYNDEGELLRQRARVTLDCECWFRWDLNGDGQVTTLDIIEFLPIYGANVSGTDDASLDLDGDGIIGSTELVDLLSQTGGTCLN